MLARAGLRGYVVTTTRLCGFMVIRLTLWVYAAARLCGNAVMRPTLHPMARYVGPHDDTVRWVHIHGPLCGSVPLHCPLNVFAATWPSMGVHMITVMWVYGPLCRSTWLHGPLRNYVLGSLLRSYTVTWVQG